MPTSGPHQAADVAHPGGMGARRVFPTDRREHLDPFVVFERFFIDPDQGFDTHPHRGFEIVSFMLDGEMAHEDSMGHESVAGPGDAMRITTGSGMQHAELPAGEGSCSGLQLWVNLPRERKDVDPGYADATAEELPTAEESGATVTTVLGDGSPLSLHTSVTYRVATVSGTWEWLVPDGWNGFAYAVAGDGAVDGEPIAPAEYVIVEGGDELEFAASEELRVAAVAGAPHGEPIRQRGPFVE